MVAPPTEPTIGVRLWPQVYAVARLRSVPEPFPAASADGAPVAVFV